MLHYRNGKERIVDYDKSGYLRGFANGLFFRPSCSVCPFACDKRISDLTIGDAWGIEKEKLNLNPHQGVSLILVNNNKGEQWMERVQKVMVLYKVSTQQMVSENGRLKCPDKGHINRQDFFNRYVDEDFEKLVQDLIPRISLGRKIGHKIKEMKRRLG